MGLISKVRHQDLRPLFAPCCHLVSASLWCLDHSSAHLCRLTLYALINGYEPHVAIPSHCPLPDLETGSLCTTSLSGESDWSS